MTSAAQGLLRSSCRGHLPVKSIGAYHHEVGDPRNFGFCQKKGIVMVDSASYEQALSFLYGRIDYERSAAAPPQFRRLHLERMGRLLQLLDDPQRRLPAVHIAGTKGKGSTAAMVDAILRAAGFSTGLYTSPHLDRLEDRFVVNGLPCPVENLIELVETVRPAVAKMDATADEWAPTFFEITTALAMLHFARQEVDYAVFEVGMGGRLDSTNVCHPIVSVVTNISLDHTKQLGATLAAIAGEKAGIIRPGVPVVSGVRPPAPRDVIREVAARNESPLFELETDFNYVHESPRKDEPIPRSAFDYTETSKGGSVHYEAVDLPLVGEHQVANASIAIAVCERLKQQGLGIDECAIRTGLQDLVVPARIEVIGTRPTVVLDTAHNVASVEALIDALRRFKGSRRVLIFATTGDKDARGMLRQLVPQFDELIFTRYLNNPRAVDPAELAELARQVAANNDVRPQVFGNPASAWSRYWQDAQPDDLVCIAGSFFLAAELRPLISAALADGREREPVISAD